MGFFSWKCSECDESVTNKWSNHPKNSNCVLVTPDKNYHEPAYDGYGVFDGHDVYELLGNGDRDKAIGTFYNGDRESLPFKIKIVHTRCAGKSYDELNESDDCPQQGFFFDEEEA